MLLNDIKISLRNLRKYKFFSALNIVGLALSMSVSLVIITIVRNQFGYDTFHPAPERTYRVITEALRKEDGSEKYASSPFPIAEALRNDYAVTEAVTSLSFGPSGDAVVGASTLPIRSFYADPAFFHVFNFPLEAGNAADALAEPFSLVLTREAAVKFFGQENPMGQTVDIRGFGQFKVTGVLKKITQKTHFDFEALASSATIAPIEKNLPPEAADRSLIGNWTNYYGSFTYALLPPGKTKAELETVLAELAESRYRGLALETRDAGYRFAAQNLLEISPSREILSQTIERAMPIFVIWGLLGFVVLLTVFPCINYANLTIARALVRAREVGIRKVMGARRGELMRQFLTEAVLTTGIALVLAWGLRLVLNAFVVRMIPDSDLQSDLYNPLAEDTVTWAAFIGLALLTGLLAGWAPARYLSRFRPDAALRDVSKIRLFSRMTLRKALIVTQFTVSIIFVIVVSALWQQTNYALRAEYGFDKDNLVEVRLQGQDYRTLAAEIARDHRVVRVSASSHSVGTWQDGSVDLRKTRDGEPVQIRHFAVDQQYVENHGLQLLAGQNFPADANPRRQQFILLNEKALETLSLGAPAEAVGKTLWLDDTTEVAVLGVVKNYHFRPVTFYTIGPLALLFRPSEFNQLDVRLAPGDPSAALAHLEGVWKKLDPVHPIRYAFLDEEVRNCYAEMRTMTAVIGFFGLLAISIACLGLLGIVTFTVETRGKEISIRKVIGASVADLALLLSRNFLALLGIAVFLALPVGYLLADQLLNFFAYRVPIGFGILGGGALVLIVLGLLTVGVQTVRAALGNPVENLRNE